MRTDRIRPRKILFSSHQACIPEFGGDLLDRTGDVLGDLGAGADHLSGAEAKASLK